MVYLLTIPIIISCFYTFTYGLNILKSEKNKLSAFGIFLLSILGAIIPILYMFAKN